mmetsp:Transcript_46127/g.99977  ORF Transcript_46127/g.99977 Transcript_46127/m.99977 type:complete len:114 (+) Transcript_46127:154-495(+)
MGPATLLPSPRLRAGAPILSPCHAVAMSCCRRVILYPVDMPCCRRAMLSPCHAVAVSCCRHAILSPCHGRVDGTQELPREFEELKSPAYRADTFSDWDQPKLKEWPQFIVSPR